MDIVMKQHPITGKMRPQEKDFNEGRRVVRVLPKNDDIRKYIRHPKTRVGWLTEGSAEWPNDAFTKRRIADGDVTIERAAPQGEQGEQGESKAIEQKSGGKAPAEKPEPARSE
jgi:hypothetical protein